MQTEELVKLVTDIKDLRAETQTIELKAATKGCPTRLFDTLSSFSNQDDGGIIIFGVDESDDFNVTGVYDPQDLQKKVTEQCKQMEPVVRPLFTICTFEDKTIVSAEIPSIDVSDRPVFYRGVGRIKGSYIRVGESDEHMSEYEIYSYETFRKRIRDDIRTISPSSIPLPNKDRIKAYLEAVKRERANLGKNVSDEEIFELMGITNHGKPTLSGLLTFSNYPQSIFPQLCITAISVPGTKIADEGAEGERFIDNKRITGSISDMLEEAVEFVRRNSRTKTIIDNDGHRLDRPEYPIKAVREAILNALIHRDYSIHSENTPISVEMYRDRLEVKNCGGLYGRISIDELGKVRPETRNAALANMLEILNITENRYSGIPTMRSELKKASLPAPVFSVLHGEFKVAIKNGYQHDLSEGNGSILDYCETPRTRSEIVNFVGKSNNYVMSTLVKPLVEEGKLKMTIPSKPKSVYQKFVTA